MRISFGKQEGRRSSPLPRLPLMPIECDALRHLPNAAASLTRGDQPVLARG